jgi:hypothetical protein
MVIRSAAMFVSLFAHCSEHLLASMDTQIQPPLFPDRMGVWEICSLATHCKIVHSHWMLRNPDGNGCTRVPGEGK